MGGGEVYKSVGYFKGNPKRSMVLFCGRGFKLFLLLRGAKAKYNLACLSFVSVSSRLYTFEGFRRPRHKYISNSA